MRHQHQQRLIQAEQEQHKSFASRPEVAFARFTGATGVMTGQWNIASNTRTGAGAYTLVTNITFDTTAMVLATVIGGAAQATVDINNPSADFVTWLVTTFLIGAATDENCSVYFERSVF